LDVAERLLKKEEVRLGVKPGHVQVENKPERSGKGPAPQTEGEGAY